MKRLILLFIVLLFLPACLYAVRYDATYKGRIIDAETRQPIEGVVVLGIWYKGYPTVAGVKHKFYDAREMVSDKKGEFEISGVGLRVMSNVEPMYVMIFKAGYESIGMGPWESFKLDGGLLMKKIDWDGERAIIPLKKLTMAERKKERSFPSLPPGEAPKEKVILILKEINKEAAARGLEVIDKWGGETIYEKNNTR